MTIRDLDPGVDMLRNVLDEALEQCIGGKGNERHGHGSKLLSQPWLFLAAQHGAGFLTGQACKKLCEAASMYAKGDFTAEQYEREVLGAIVYSAFAIVYGRMRDGAGEDEPPTPLHERAGMAFDLCDAFHIDEALPC